MIPNDLESAIYLARVSNKYLLKKLEVYNSKQTYTEKVEDLSFKILARNLEEIIDLIEIIEEKK